jgi:hypothetical protein
MVSKNLKVSMPQRIIIIIIIHIIIIIIIIISEFFCNKKLHASDNTVY